MNATKHRPRRRRVLSRLKFERAGWVAIVVAIVASTAGAESTVNNSSYSAPVVFELDGAHPVQSKTVRVLDRKVLGFQNGMSVGMVRSELGGETRGIVGGSSVTLLYGPWSLIFTKNGLTTRSRQFKRLRNVNEKDFDERIVGLELGMPVQAVRSVLGQPNVLSVQATGFGPEMSLTYGEWRLIFVGRRLDSRNRLW